MLEAVRVGGWLMVVVRVQEVARVGAIEECSRGIWYAPHPKGQRVLHVHHGKSIVLSPRIYNKYTESGNRTR